MARFFPALILCFCLTFQGYSQSSWQKHKSPISANLHNIFFVSDSVGWITSHKTGAILHTRDAGKNWFVQTQMDSIFFEDIFFLDSQNGWVTAENGLIFKTINGGKTWGKRQIADDQSWIYAIHFLNPKRGIAIGMRESKPMKIFLATDNGGKNWDKAGITVPEAFYSAITFVNDSEGYSAGLRYILYTSDGGKKWKKQFADTASPPKKAPVIRDLFFSDRNNGWAVGHKGLVLKTTDGKNWELINPFTKNRLRSIAFTSLTKGYVAGDSNIEPGVLYHTDNSGKTWETVLTNTPDLHRITLTSKTIWLVGANGTILSKPRTN